MPKPDKRLLLKDRLSPVTYFRVVNAILPEDWMMWEPETVWAELETETGIPTEDMSALTKNKIMAYRMVHNTSAPWEDWSVFLNVCLVFNDIVPNVESVQVCSPSQIAWTITKLLEVHPEWPFSESVQSIVAAMLYDDGICWSPGVLGDLVNDNLFYLQRHYEQLPEFAKALAENYLKNIESERVEGDGPADIHTARLKAIDQYISIKQVIEEAANYVL